MQYLSPYLFMNGNCREVMEFYKQCIGRELFVQTVGESPVASNFEEKFQTQVLHAALMDGKKMLVMASDMVDGSTATHGNTVDLALVCESKEELERIFEKLSVGGEVKMPLKEEFFGTFVGFVDKYGFSWMLQYSKDEK